MKQTSIRKKGKHDASSLPWRIPVYLAQHFDNASLNDIKKVRRNGQIFYQIVIDTVGNIYRIKFNSDGYLVQKVMEPVFDTVLDETGVGD
ncbi:MAG TPA: hypothetical protein VI757_03190 [Bacteroidia bacterium]|nr:hypothetical protein [Bacteroidia bacterium]